MRRAFVVVGIIVIAFVAAFFIRYSAIQKAKIKREAMIKAAEVDTAIPVRTAPVVTGDVENVLRYTGAVEPAEKVDVYSKIAGRVVSLKVKEGDTVTKDQVIAIVDPEVTGQRFEPFEVTAPLAGKISVRMVDPGAFVNQMMPIVEIINDSSVKVTIDVLEKDYHVVPKGTSVRIEFDALPGEVKMASITNTSPVVDRATGTAKAEINLDNRAGKLRTGMFARVQVIAETHKGVVLVPRDATLSEVLAGFGSVIQTQVFVVKDDRAQVRDVKLGLANATYFEVLEGLAPGDVVITTGQNIVRDGSKVRITGS